MQIRKKVNVILLAVFICFICCSCTNNQVEVSLEETSKDDEEMNMELTERQIAILQQQGLSDEYKDLSLFEKSAICSIEEMLVYMEEKYGVGFCYSSYALADSMTPECLTVYEENDNTKKIITVYRTYSEGIYIYEDDYLEVAISDSYREVLEEFFGIEIGLSQYQIYVDVKELGEKTDNVIECVSATSYIYINNTNDYDLDELIGDYSTWMINQNLESTALLVFVLQNQEEFDETYSGNYSQQILQKKYDEIKRCLIASDLSIEIY